MLRSFYFIIILIVTSSIQAQNQSTKIAFVADIHLLDIYADYENFDGLPVSGAEKKAKIRMMNAQLHSTRLFNENYFVLKAVLEDIAKRGIELVAFPGDYTDDGQPINLKGLAEILKEYKENYGISFFITTGNHDPVQPFNTPAGKNDFLGVDGKNQPIYSKIGL
ncbi:MAG: metallophosphoesterase, partial [Leeuwenhoekiella sp.]